MQQRHHAHFIRPGWLWTNRFYYRGWTGSGKARQMDCDTISLPPSARQRGERCIPTAPYADISSDQRQLSPLRLNQRETLDRAHRWPAPDKQRYTTLLRWLQTWLCVETVYRIIHDGYNVIQNPSSLRENSQSFLKKKIWTQSGYFLYQKPCLWTVSLAQDVK